LNYYDTGYDEKQAQEQKKILQNAKGLIARLDAYKNAKSVKKIQNKTTPTVLEPRRGYNNQLRSKHS